MVSGFGRMSEEYLRKLAMLIHCSEWLERLSAEFYDLLSRKVSDESAASLMRVISTQSEAHADTMVAAFRLLDLQDFLVERVDCVELTKPVGKATLDLMDTLRGATEVNASSYKEILDKLEFLEIGIGEETYHKILQPLLRALVETVVKVGDSYAELKLKVVSDLLDDVTRQEELHEKLIMKAYDMLSRNRGDSPRD